MARASRSLRRQFVVTVVVTGLLTGLPGLLLPAVKAGSVDDARRKVQRVADALEAAQDEVDVLAEDLVTAQNDRDTLEAEIVTTESDIAAKAAELDGVQAQMSEVAVQSFIGGGRGGSITNLLTPGVGPNESVQKQTLTEMALNAGFISTDELDALVTDLENLRKKLSRQRDRAAELAKQIEKKKAAAEDKIEKYTELKTKVERELGQALRAEQQRRAEAAARAARSQAGSFLARRGDGSQVFDRAKIPPASSRAQIAIAAARSQVGVPYIAYKAIEGVGFDCSGLTMWAWAQAGVSLPHQSRRQANSTTRIPIEYIEPGDLVYFHNPISHVGIYIGNGMMIDAPATGKDVRIAPVRFERVVAVTRPG